MNILRHKSWHVRNRNNIERVRRDEAKAAEEEKEKEKRILLAERESRIQLLRKKANIECNKDNDNISNDDCDKHLKTTKNLGIFNSVVGDDRGDKLSNVEHDKEKRKEKEDWEKKIGLLTFLGQSQTETSIDKPWYLKSHEERMKLVDNEKKLDEFNLSANQSNKYDIDTKVKNFHDPLNDMKRYMEQMKQKQNKVPQRIDEKNLDLQRKEFLVNTNKLTETYRHEKQSKHKKKKKYHSHHRHHHHHHDKSKKKKKSKRKKDSLESKANKEIDNSDDSDSDEQHEEDDDEDKRKRKLEMLSKLREERMKREKSERERERKLLLGKVNETDMNKTVIDDDRKRNFNSQFNPQLAKQNN